MQSLSVYDITGIEYHHTVEDVDVLRKLAASLPTAPIIVNIGACFGTSSLSFLTERPDAFIFSIDIGICPKEKEHIEYAGGNSNRVVRVLGPSQQVGRFWPWPVDMVFVDGAHDYDNVRVDATLWRKKVKPGGIIAFHDYGRPSLPHVKRAVDEVMKEPFLQQDTIVAYRM